MGCGHVHRGAALRARLSARIIDGRAVDLRGEPPLSVKATARADHLELTLVGSAASLLEGDELDVDVHVEGSVPVVIRSVAAQVAHPCLDGGSTRQRLRLQATGGAVVCWAVEPLIVCAGADHRNEVLVDLHDGARVVARDIAVLGRSGEPASAAALRSVWHVRIDDRPLLDDGLDTTLPGAHGPAGLAGHRVIATVGSFGWRPPESDGDIALAGPGTLRRFVAATASDAIAAAERAADRWWSELASGHPAAAHA